ncbi:hypothetical protein JI664_19200 [Rhodobacter sp. NTK016B]|uniref:hypothetical protein n=1 Tax=Rhodobacter sp. NTK016B TaxID=2759676 RepID=UPI001A8EB3F2|nr:hypothetical protein [Rhodobacter sp. NTK016B]MBN8294106.1 hypothetical protein [Rhodobacter sp. NTK016B]
MSQPLRLEVFETADTVDGPVLMTPEEVEDLRLNAYEKGYVAGWDDSGQQADAEASTRRAAIERQVEQLSFTYHEARGHILSALDPLLRAIAETILPPMARASVVPLIIDQLLPLAQAGAEAPITLRVGPGSEAAFREAMEGLLLPPLDIVETEDLTEGQAEFALGAAQTRIDLTDAALAIATAIDRFYQIQPEESQRA